MVFKCFYGICSSLRETGEEKESFWNELFPLALLDFVLSWSTQVNRHQKGKTRKVKPVWIYWSKR